MVPDFHHCIVCEGVREEVRGKLTLLGFYGICPNVEILVLRLDQPTVLVFVIVGGPGDGTFDATFDITAEDGRVLVQVAPGPLTAVPHSKTLAAVTMPAVFGQAGTYSLRLFLDGVMEFTGQFRVLQATAAMTATVAVPR